MNEQIAITGSPADLAAFLNSFAEETQINLLIEPDRDEGGDEDGAEEADG